MQFSKILFGVLPALALAEDGRSTTTCTATTTLTKTMTLSKVHSVTASLNTTISATPTPSGSTSFTSAPVSTTGSGEEPPTVTDSPDAGSAMDASRVALAGVMGMVVVAMM